MVKWVHLSLISDFFVCGIHYDKHRHKKWEIKLQYHYFDLKSIFTCNRIVYFPDFTTLWISYLGLFFFGQMMGLVSKETVMSAGIKVISANLVSNGLIRVKWPYQENCGLCNLTVWWLEPCRLVWCLIIYMKKFLHTDWLRTCQLTPNSAKTWNFSSVERRN